MTRRALSVGLILFALGRAQAQLPTDAAAAVALSAEQGQAVAGQARSVSHAALNTVLGATQSAGAAQGAGATQTAPPPPPAVVASVPPDIGQVTDSAPAADGQPPADAAAAHAGAGAAVPRRGRDPFRPFTLDLRPEVNEAEILTPLQRYELPQLRLAAVVLDLRPPRAMLQDNSGMGYIVTPGTPIGRRHGVVKAIEPRRIVVEEQVLDYYGREQVHQVLIEMPKENKPQQGPGQE